MPVSTLSAVLLSLVTLAAPAAAATMSAEMEGHNVHSQFLSGGFIPLPPGPIQAMPLLSGHLKDMSSTTVAPPADTPGPDCTPMLSSLSKPPFTNPNPQVDVSPEPPSDPFGSGASDTIVYVGPSPSTGVGTVPLPGALPMFGLALLILCGLGAQPRRRAAFSKS